MLKKFLLVLFLTSSSFSGFAEPLLIKIGVSLPLSGALAEYGEAVRNGILLAKKDHEASLSKVQFIFDDNAYDQKKSISSVQKLIAVDDVNVLVIWGNEPALAVAPLVERRKIPTIAVAQHPEVSVGRPHVIRFMNSGDQYSLTLLSFLRSRGISNLLIVKSELSFFNMLIDGLKKYSKDETIEVVDSFLPSEMDFRTSILKLKSQKFDILGLYLISPQVKEFMRQLKQLGLSPSIFGATPFESKNVIADSWQLMEGAVFTHNAVTKNFQAKYLETYSSDVQVAYAANAYDFAQITGTISSTLKDLTADSILNAYAAVPPSANGASGPYYFKDTKEGGKSFEFDIVVREIKQGTAREVFRSNFGTLN